MSLIKNITLENGGISTNYDIGVDIENVDGLDLSDYIEKSDTVGLVKNDGTIDTNTYTPSTILTGTLTAGNTTLTLTNAAITTSSLVDVYTNVFGLSPTNITVSIGTMTLTFTAQQSDVSVKVLII